MAVNINIGMQRYEGNANESFEETTEQRGQEDLSSSSQPESNPQSNMQYEADVNPPQSNTSIDSPATPAPLLQPEETAPLPTFSRYGMGDTVIMGRPDYTSHSRIGLAKFESSSEREPVDGQSSFANQARPANDPVLSPRIPYSPASAAPIAPATPMPKPGSNGVPASVLVPELKPATIPATTVTHAPILGGQLVTLTPLARPTNPNALPTPDSLPSNRTPYLYPGLHTAPEQSPHYAIAVIYGREHGYNDDEIMKLAVLMQNNGDKNMGSEWLSLKPAVLRAAVNAVVRNTDNSFDTSGVFGGQRGYNRVNTQRIPADAATAAYEFSGDGAPQYASAPPEGWVLVEQTVNSPGSSGDGSTDSTTTTLRYYIPQNEINVVDESAYLPLAVAGYMQVPHGYESELSVGADGGVNDLNALDFDPEFGLITRTDNYRPYHADDNDWDRFMGIVVTVGISAGAMAAIGPVIAAGMGASPAGVVAAGAANAVIGSAITTMLQEGEVTFRGLLQAAFSGGMIAGLGTLDSYQALNNLGLDPKNPNIVTSYALRAISITGTSTIRGAIQELIGGRFRDGFTQGVVQGLSGELTRYLNTEIDAGLAHQQITPAQANALRELTRFTGSALRAAANPNDPMYAFAQDYLTQLFGPPVATTNTNGGNKIPDDAETQQQIIWAREAIDSGYSETAVGYLNDIVERRAAANPNVSRTDIANQLMRELGIKPDTLGFVVGANGNVTVTERVDRPTAVTRLAAAYRLNDPTISQLEAEQAANVYIDQHGIPAVFPERLMLTVVVKPDKPLPFTTGSEIVDQIIGAVGGSAMTGYNYVSGLVHGIADITLLSADGLLDIVNKVIGEDVFPDSAQRNIARADMFNNIVANLDQLPSQVAQYFNDRLERANQMDAAGDHIGAARERTELIGDLISMVTNPRTPSAMRILERLGVDPAWFERTSQTQRAFRDAAISQEHRINPAFANADMSLFEAHHTIPINAFPGLNALRAQLREWGIDINSVENGVMLPGRNAPAGLQGTYHLLLSDPGYGRALEERFVGINDAAAARRELAAINNELRNGTFHFTPGKK